MLSNYSARNAFCANKPFWGFQGGTFQAVKDLLASAGDIRDTGWEDPLKEGMATHFSVLTWRIPWTEEPGSLQSIVLHRVRHN